MLSNNNFLLSLQMSHSTEHLQAEHREYFFFLFFYFFYAFEKFPVSSEECILKHKLLSFYGYDSAPGF